MMSLILFRLCEFSNEFSHLANNSNMHFCDKKPWTIMSETTLYTQAESEYCCFATTR